MDIYQKKSRWKWILALAGVIILAISLVYTSYLAEHLARGERFKAELFAKAQNYVNNSSLVDDVTFPLEILRNNKDIPAILVSAAGGIEMAVNFGEGRDSNEVFLAEQIELIKASKIAPIVLKDDKIVYYKQSRLLNMLTYFPVIQFLLLAIFVLAGYYFFSSARRSEQNMVWVGMAKETAHQLGTPITAIVAWIEHLREGRSEDAEVQEILVELDKDVDRLNLIADRFSKIGSEPELQPTNMYEQLEEIRAYMQRRAPRKVVFDFPDVATQPVITGRINKHLFTWVLENLLRNSLDAMSGTGKIKARLTQEGNKAVIEISDSGKGIPNKKFKTVFQPGYSTKKRGWGLGLSLSKRIIESYHSGKIFVKSSTVDKGTTFRIVIPS